MKAGLFFGSFNPIHIGHMAMAEYIYEYSDLDELWFVISPQNPLKKKQSLLHDHHRLQMVHLAIGNDLRFRVSDVESRMPRPSYTIDTLSYLTEKHPHHDFVLIMGADNLKNFYKWKNYEQLIEKYTRYVYPRNGMSAEEINKHENVVPVDAPRIDISSSFVRNAIREGKTMKYFVPPAVWQYIDHNLFYRK